MRRSRAAVLELSMIVAMGLKSGGYLEEEELVKNLDFKRIATEPPR